MSSLQIFVVNRPTWPVQFRSPNVRLLPVHVLKTRFSADWRLLGKECITNFGLSLDVFCRFNDVFFLLSFFCLFFFSSLCILVFANQPTVHSGGVTRGRVCGCVTWHGTLDNWHRTYFFLIYIIYSPSCLFWYWL